MSEITNFNQFKGAKKYIASPELRAIVNVAIALGRPLLVKGEPGTGKTLLAHAIAEDLGKKLIVWNVKSTTTAKDGCYIYDTVQRLNDARFGEGQVSDIKRYIHLGKLGEAFVADEQVQPGLRGRLDALRRGDPHAADAAHRLAGVAEDEAQLVTRHTGIERRNAFE